MNSIFLLLRVSRCVTWGLLTAQTFYYRSQKGRHMGGHQCECEHGFEGWNPEKIFFHSLQMCTVGAKQQQSKSTITKLNMISFTICTFRPFKILYNSRPDNNRNRQQRPKFVWSLFNINKSTPYMPLKVAKLPAASIFDRTVFYPNFAQTSI